MKTKKIAHRHTSVTNGAFCCGDSIENFKRRRAFMAFHSLDMGSRLFFERILNVRKSPDPVFITKSKEKNR